MSGTGKGRKSRAPDWIDEHVALRMRLRRKQLGMSQTVVAKLIGTTYQQFQKYETGQNRVGAGRLYEISQALDAPVQYFFDDLADDGSAKASVSDGPSRPVLPVREIENVVSAYGSISNKAMRETILALMKSISRSTP